MVDDNNINFELPIKDQANMIKVIGVGGGGGNAVNYMFEQKINGVEFVICNTDLQALHGSCIPTRIQLGHDKLGTGAGGNPEKGQEAAKESIESVQQTLGGHTKMVFITAGMGGGTGTGAAPIIAQAARELGLLVVGIVTSPFKIEGKKRLERAKAGIEVLRQNVDSLIVINNDKLIEVYGNLGITEGYAKADEVLSIAAKGIAEVITNYYKQNIDFQDAKTVLENSGTAIMGASTASGEDRAKNAIIKALDSPLLNDNKITGAKNVLLLIVSGKEEITFNEVNEITEYIQDEAGHDAEIFLGYGKDDSLEDGIALTVVATGFAMDQQNTISNIETKKTIYSLDDDQSVTVSFQSKDSLKKMSDFSQFMEKTENSIVSPLSNIEKDLSYRESVDFHKVEQEDSSSRESVTDKTSDVVLASQLLEDIDVVYDQYVLSPEGEVVIVSSEIGANVNNAPLYDFEETEFEIKDSAQGLVEGLGIDSKFHSSNVSQKQGRDLGIENTVKSPDRNILYLDDDLKAMGMSNSSSRNSRLKSFINNVSLDDEELGFTVRSTSKGDAGVQKDVIPDQELTPFNCTIEDLKKRTVFRKGTLKDFNYKFKNSIEEDLLLQSNIDITSNLSGEKISLRKDNDDFDLGKNIFLNDNVD